MGKGVPLRPDRHHTLLGAVPLARGPHCRRFRPIGPTPESPNCVRPCVLCATLDDARRLERPLHPYAAARRPRDNAAGRLERAALALVADGWTTELQATVVHRRLAPSVAGYAIAAITAILISFGWPRVGVVLAALVALGGGIDLVGGRSWVRALTPRRGHRNILLWASSKPPDPTPGPWPGLEAADADVPQLLLVLPDRPGATSVSYGTALGAFFGLVALASIASSFFLAPAPNGTLLAATAAGLFFISVIAISIDRSPGRPKAAPGVAAARALMERLPADLHARVGIVIVGALEPWFDGVEVLLQSRRRRLPPDRTDILVWHPGPGPVQKVLHDGAFGRPAHERLVQAAASLPTAPRRWLRPRRTAALRAARMGWPALGLVGGGIDDASIDTISTVLSNLADRR